MNNYTHKTKKQLLLDIQLLKKKLEQSRGLGFTSLNNSKEVAVSQMLPEKKCYQSLFENAPVGILSVDRNGNILEANKGLLKLLDSPSLEVTKSINIFTLPALQETKLQSVIEKCFNSGEKVSAEGKYTSTWGKMVQTSFQAVPGVVNEDGIQSVQIFIDDITHRKKAEEEILIARDRYETLFNASPIPMWEEDFTNMRTFIQRLRLEGVRDIEAYLLRDPKRIVEFLKMSDVLDVNQAAVKLFEAKTKALLISGFEKILTQSFFDTIIKAIGAISNNEFQFAQETEVRTFSNKIKTVILSIKIDANDRINRAIIGITDITASRNTKEQLKLSEAKFKSLVNHSINGIITINPSGVITFANKAISQIIKYPLNEIVGQHFATFLDEESVELGLDVFSSSINRKDSPDRNDLNVKRKNGEVRRIEVLSNVVKGADKKQIIIAHISDINERWRYEKTQNVLLEISKLSSTTTHLRTFLKKVHHRLNQLIKTDNFFVALYRKDSDEYTLPYYSDEMDDFETKKPIKAKNTLTDYVRRTQMAQLINQERKAQLLADDEVMEVGKKSKIWLGAPLLNDSYNKVIGVIGIQDYHNENALNNNDLEILKLIANNVGFFIDKVKNLNDLKKAKEKAEESDRLKSAFLANMSHEIRTPLNGILGFTQLLKINNLPAEERIECLDVIEESGARLLDTVNDVIDISKIESGQIQMHYAPVNINEQLRYLHSFFSTEARQRNLKLVFNYQMSDKEATIISDKNKLTAILKNLIKNALKYTMKGRIELDLFRANDFFMFKVTDTGIGIPEDRQNAIFDRFVQADLEDKDAREGAGLGLSITKAYVEMLGGDLGLQSVEDQGSSFYFTTPVKKEVLAKV